MNVSHVWISVRELIDQSKLMLVVQEIFRPRRSCRSSRSSKACAEPDQPIDRSNPSVATARNGRRAICADSSRRILSGQSDMTGCAPASRCTTGTSYRLTGCEGPKRRQHAALRAAPAAIFGWLVLVSVQNPASRGWSLCLGFISSRAGARRLAAHPKPPNRPNHIGPGLWTTFHRLVGESDRRHLSRGPMSAAIEQS